MYEMQVEVGCKNTNGCLTKENKNKAAQSSSIASIIKKKQLTQQVPSGVLKSQPKNNLFKSQIANENVGFI